MVNIGHAHMMIIYNQLKHINGDEVNWPQIEIH